LWFGFQEIRGDLGLEVELEQRNAGHLPTRKQGFVGCVGRSRFLQRNAGVDVLMYMLQFVVGDEQ